MERKYFLRLKLAKYCVSCHFLYIWGPKTPHSAHYFGEFYLQKKIRYIDQDLACFWLFCSFSPQIFMKFWHFLLLTVHRAFWQKCLLLTICSLEYYKSRVEILVWIGQDQVNWKHRKSRTGRFYVLFLLLTVHRAIWSKWLLQTICSLSSYKSSIKNLVRFGQDEANWKDWKSHFIIF